METTRRGFLEALAGAIASLSVGASVSEVDSGVAPPLDWVEPYLFFQVAHLQAIGDYTLLDGMTCKPFGLRGLCTIIDPAASLAATTQFFDSCQVSLHLGPGNTEYFRGPAYCLGTWADRVQIQPQLFFPARTKFSLRANLCEPLAETVRIETVFEGVRSL